MKIKEDLKRDVFEYLKTAVHEEKAETLALSSISETVGETKKRVEIVLKELTEEKLISEHSVSLKIFVPETDEGKKAVKRFARREILVSSPYLAIFIAIGILWVSVPYLDLKMPETVDGLISAYYEGVKYGIGCAFLSALVGGYIIQNVINRFMKWRVLSEETYTLISMIAKYTIFLSVGGIVAYYLLERLGVKVSSVVVTIILGILAVVIAYVGLIEKKKREKKRR